MKEIIRNILQANALRYYWWRCFRLGKEKAYRTAFVEIMNERAGQLGMTNTRYNTPSGLLYHGEYSITTARDLCFLANAARLEKRLNIFWEKEYIINRHVPICLCIDKHQSKRIVAKIPQTKINGYPILLEKTGGGDGHYALLMVAEIKGKTICAAIMEALDEQHRFVAMEELLSGVELIMDGEMIKDCVTSASSACAYIVEHGQMRCLYEQLADERYPTMSTAKMMTVLIAINVLDKNWLVRVTPYDVEGTGVGDFLYRWDRISVYDLFYLCLLPSCCLAANILGRIAGEKIMLKENYSLKNESR